MALLRWYGSPGFFDSGLQVICIVGSGVSHLPLDQGWAINFPKGPHEKLGRLQRAVGRVYGGRGRSLFARNIAVSPVTAVNKAAQRSYLIN